MSGKTILIPVDLKVSSLKTLKLALEHEESSELVIILLFPRLLNDSITELLFYSEYKLIEQNMTPEFKEGLEMIKNRYETRWLSVHIRQLAFDSTAYFKRFIEVNQVETIYYPKSYRLNLGTLSFDLSRHIDKSGCRSMALEWSHKPMNEREALSELIK